MGFLGHGGKKERVHGRLIVKGEHAHEPGEGFAYTLAFVRAGPRQEAPHVTSLDALPPDAVAATVAVVTCVDPAFAVELPPGHYQVLARARPCKLEGEKLLFADEFFEEHPLAHAFEVVKGHEALLNLAVKPRESASTHAAQGVAHDAIAIVWASDHRLHAREVHRGELAAQLRLVPPAARTAWKRAVELGNAGDDAKALAEYDLALVDVPAELREQVAEFVLDTELGRAKCLVALHREREACAVLAQHLAPGKPIRGVSRSLAVDLLMVFGEALGGVGHFEQLERCLYLAMSLAAPARNERATLDAMAAGRARCLERLAAGAPPDRVLAALDEQGHFVGPPEQDLLGARFRFDALVKLGRAGAARTFARQAAAFMNRHDAGLAAVELEKRAAELPSGPGSDPSTAITSAAADTRALEHAAGERLTAAGARGDLDALQRLAGAGPHGLDAAGSHFRTALMGAALKGQAEAVTWLLEHGASADLTDEDSRSAMMLAALHGHAPIVRALLGRGAMIDRQDLALQTALHLATSHNRVDAVRTLLEHRPALGLRDLAGMTALLIAASKDVPQVVALLVAAGAPLDDTTHEGVTALMFAAMEGHADVVRALLEAGAERNVRDAKGRTAKMWAEHERRADVAHLL